MLSRIPRLFSRRQPIALPIFSHCRREGASMTSLSLQIHNGLVPRMVAISLMISRCYTLNS
jgi:hypothetical protein